MTINCTVVIRIRCARDDDDTALDGLIEEAQGLELTLLNMGFLFTGIEQEPCDLVRTYEKELK